MTDHQVLLVGARNAQLALKSGLTTVRDCGDRRYLSLVLRDFINAGGLAGPRLGLLGTSAHQYRWSSVVGRDRVRYGR